LSYRGDLLRIDPSVNGRRGKPRFSRADAAKFLLVRKLLRSLHSSTVQAFLDFLDQTNFLKNCFPSDRPTKLPPTKVPPLELPPTEDLRKIVIDSTRRLEELRSEALHTSFLIVEEVGPERKSGFVADREVGTKKFNELIDLALKANCNHALISIGDIDEEMMGRELAYCEGREFVAPSAAVRALAAAITAANRQREKTSTKEV
jgi:hypothetical protein